MSTLSADTDPEGEDLKWRCLSQVACCQNVSAAVGSHAVFVWACWLCRECHPQVTKGQILWSHVGFRV